MSGMSIFGGLLRLAIFRRTVSTSPACKAYSPSKPEHTRHAVAHSSRIPISRCLLMRIRRKWRMIPSFPILPCPYTFDNIIANIVVLALNATFLREVDTAWFLPEALLCFLLFSKVIIAEVLHTSIGNQLNWKVQDLLDKKRQPNRCGLSLYISFVLI